MKKFFIYFCSFIFICFILPALLTKLEVPANSNNDEKVDENDTIDSDIEKYSYNKYATIKLLHTNTNEIEEEIKKIKDYKYKNKMTFTKSEKFFFTNDEIRKILRELNKKRL